MKVLLTGARGFIARNLAVHLSERNDIELVSFSSQSSPGDLHQYVQDIDFVYHLAGVNRPEHEAEFQTGNVEFTSQLCQAIEATGRAVPIIYSSSIQAALDNPYGKSKRKAEEVIEQYGRANDVAVHIFRLPNVFGKWCRPNYNSVVATFCHNIANDIPIEIHDPDHKLELVYIDDVVSHFIDIVDTIEVEKATAPFPVYTISVGELARKIDDYKASRNTLTTEPVGKGLDRALYSTYLSYLKPEQFSYSLVKHEDHRGWFVEALKTKDSGQFSFFTALPNVTRGGHYHHTKTEKFIVVKGEALFRFKNVVTEEYYELTCSSEKPEVVETVPGWTHDITNIGQEEMIVMLWANEIFDPLKPDTFAKSLLPN